MVSPGVVVRIYRQLDSQGIKVWLCGGWGIDALLGKHTRPHKDLDVLMLVDDVLKLGEVLSRSGYQLKEIWSENHWATDSGGNKIATAFVLHDGAGGELDAHAFRFDAPGNAIPAWEAGERFMVTQSDLSGEGMIEGCPVRCLSAESQVVCHTGYTLPDYQKPDLDQLYEKFGVGFPAEASNQEARNG